MPAAAAEISRGVPTETFHALRSMEPANTPSAMLISIPSALPQTLCSLSSNPSQSQAVALHQRAQQLRGELLGAQQQLVQANAPMSCLNLGITQLQQPLPIASSCEPRLASAVDVSVQTRERVPTPSTPARTCTTGQNTGTQTYFGQHQRILRPASIDTTILAMDAAYGTRFHNWIRSENNLDCSAQHLRRICPEYDLHRIATGIRWMVSDWRISSIARLIRIITERWPISRAATLAGLVSNDWLLAPFTTRLVYFLVKDLCLEDSVDFIFWLTASWSLESSLELVIEMRDLLSWSTTHHDGFVLRFVWCLRKHRPVDKKDLGTLRKFCWQTSRRNLPLGTLKKTGRTSDPEATTSAA
eukprot:comp5780_c0_seq1/m.1650 comp5780_c0_seq1/g.1650  ORF comp5780_c0_seq1/g.1650 comp5780_c0_seq1/m.1650 type:complete len:358 (-) comp5780_c0_seq1:175-1248(-)